MAELSTIARPYADAVFQRAVEVDQIVQWSEDLQTLSRVIADADVANILDNPTLSRDQRLDIVLSVIDEHLQAEVKNLVCILSANDRLEALPEISRAFDDLKVDHEGKIDVEVISAFPLDDAQTQLLSDALQKRLGKQVNIAVSEDTALIGGLIIKAGDLVIDGSVKEKLNRIAIDLGI